MSTNIESNAELIGLRAMLARWEKRSPTNFSSRSINGGEPFQPHSRDTLKRRIYALEQEIELTFPFNDVDECLYRCWR